MITNNLSYGLTFAAVDDNHSSPVEKAVSPNSKMDSLRNEWQRGTSSSPPPHSLKNHHLESTATPQIKDKLIQFALQRSQTGLALQAAVSDSVTREYRSNSQKHYLQKEYFKIVAIAESDPDSQNKQKEEDLPRKKKKKIPSLHSFLKQFQISHDCFESVPLKFKTILAHQKEVEEVKILFSNRFKNSI